jgi:hypothetical protein
MIKGLAAGAIALVLGSWAAPASAAPLGTLDGIKSETTSAADLPTSPPHHLRPELGIN